MVYQSVGSGYVNRDTIVTISNSHNNTCYVSIPLKANSVSGFYDVYKGQEFRTFLTIPNQYLGSKMQPSLDFPERASIRGAGSFTGDGGRQGQGNDPSGPADRGHKIYGKCDGKFTLTIVQADQVVSTTVGIVLKAQCNDPHYTYSIQTKIAGTEVVLFKFDPDDITTYKLNPVPTQQKPGGWVFNSYDFNVQASMFGLTYTATVNGYCKSCGGVFGQANASHVILPP